MSTLLFHTIPETDVVPQVTQHHSCISDKKPTDNDTPAPTTSLNYQLIDIVLRYPNVWHPPAQFHHHSLYASTAADEAVQWLFRLKLLDGPHEHTWTQRVRAMNVSSYGGASLVFGNYAHTLLHTKMVLLWLLWDDVIVEAAPPDSIVLRYNQQQSGDNNTSAQMINNITNNNSNSINEVDDLISPRDNENDYNSGAGSSSSNNTAELLLFPRHFRQMNYIMHGQTVIDVDINRKTILDRFAYAWQEIMDEIQQSPFITSTYLKRFGNCFSEWIYFAHRERDRVVDRLMESIIKQQQQKKQENGDGDKSDSKSNRDRVFDLYLEQRKKTIGMLNTAQLLEIACGFELPPEIWYDEDFQQLLDISALLVGLGNELVSLGKDIYHYEQNNAETFTTNTTKSIPSSFSAMMWTNLILVYCTLYEVRLSDAINFVISLHDRYVREFDEIAARLTNYQNHNNTTNNKYDDHDPTTHREYQTNTLLPSLWYLWQERLSAYIMNLRLCVFGFAFWHVSTKRYTHRLAVDPHRKEVYRILLQTTDT